MENAINIFKSLKDNRPLSKNTIEEIVSIIRTSDKLMTKTEAFRALDDDESRKSLKESCPAFMAACQVKEKRLKKDVTEISGLTIVDLDHLNEEDVAPAFGKVIADEHTLAAYVTISGRGIRIVASFEFDKTRPVSSQLSFYSTAFTYVNHYYATLTGCKYDSACSDVVRLSVMCHDSNAYYAPDATAFTKEEIVPAKAKASDEKIVSNTFKRIEKIFEKFVMPKLAEAKAEFVPGRHNDYVMRCGYLLNQAGVPLDEAIEWTVYRFGREYPECEKVIISCYNSRLKEFGRDAEAVKKGSRYAGVATLEDITDYTDPRYAFRWNTIKEREEYAILDENGEDKKYKIFEIRDRNTIMRKMSKETRLKVLPQDMDTVVISDYSVDYNPILAYLDTLPKWMDDHDYIKDLADTIVLKGGADEREYFLRCLKAWLVSMVGSWIDPKTINHSVLTLIGGQGKQKSTWFNHLMPPELEEYYKVNVEEAERNGESTLSITFYGLICIDEIEAMNAAQAKFYKELITLKGSDLRAAYDRRQKPRVHLASFCATGNNQLFLNDRDEGRRWMPFTIKSIVSPIDHPFNHTGIFSQAKTLYEWGYRGYLNEYELERHTRHNDDYRCPCMERELILENFRKPKMGETAKLMSSTNILESFSNTITGKLNLTKIGMEMKALGFESKTMHGRKVWICVPKSQKEKDAEREIVYSGSDDDDN